MTTFDKNDELWAYIAEFIDQEGFLLISIDGPTGSGKSTLAENIASKFKLAHLNLDDDRYLIPEMGGYVEYIKYDNLIADLESYRKNSSPIIIDAVCVQEILARTNTKPDLNIYVKKLRRGNQWLDGRYFDYSKNVDDVIKTDLEEQRNFNLINAQLDSGVTDNSVPKESVFHEVLRYHFSYKPDLNADILFERIDV